MRIHRSVLFLGAVFFTITSCDLLGIGGEPDIPGTFTFMSFQQEALLELILD